MTEPDQTDPIRSPLDDAQPSGRLERWSPGVSAGVRVLLLILGVGGTLAVLGAWSAGHGGMAIRILAGDIVLIVAALLALR